MSQLGSRPTTAWSLPISTAEPDGGIRRRVAMLFLLGGDLSDEARPFARDSRVLTGGRQSRSTEYRAIGRYGPFASLTLLEPPPYTPNHREARRWRAATWPRL